jgi:hypothetical protein
MTVDYGRPSATRFHASHRTLLRGSGPTGFNRAQDCAEPLMRCAEWYWEHGPKGFNPGEGEIQ